MGNYTFKLNLAGLNELMKSGPMQSIINQAAASMAASAGDGYEVEAAHPISFIAIGSVRATTFKARLDNSKNNTLLKAKGGTKI